MESILYSIKHVEFYLMFGAVLVMVGGLMITWMYEFLREKTGKTPIPTSQGVQEVAEGSATITL
jgi:hypothetical protein